MPLPHLSAHGLRKAAMRRMAEAGWSETQMGAWSGHDSKREVACYTAAASQGPYDMPWGTDGEHGVVANLTNETGKPRSPVKSTELRARIKSGRFVPGLDCNKSTLNRRCTAGQGCQAIYETSKLSPSALRDRRGELDEEIVGSLLRRTVDQALAKLGELAADLRLHVVGEQRAAILVGQRHLGAALGKARDAPLAFPEMR
jgi:hypothetical protein